MRIQSISIRNFRRFERFDCAFDPRLTLLMGENGAGKSSLLRAIFLACEGLLGDFVGSPGLRNPRSDVRRINMVDPSDEAWRSGVFPSSVQLDVDVLDSLYSLIIEYEDGSSQFRTESRDDPLQLVPPVDMYESIRRWFSSSNATAIPLFARFGPQGSTGNPSPGAVQKPFDSKQDIWQRFAQESVNISSLAQWFQYNELRSLQEGKPPLIYRVVKQTVLASIHALDVKYVVRDNQLMVLHEGQGWRPFDELSDGQKRLATVFMELAVRAAALNSHLGESCIAATPGVILIDELDLHLHPQWQRSVIDNLLDTFPELQFVIASHSPFLIQSALARGVVIDAATGERAAATDHSIEDIAEQVMGVDQPQRSQRFLEMRRLAQEYLELMESPVSTAEAKADLKARLDQALSVFADDPAAAAWLSQRRIAKGI
ncbi:AAA family ATPase [Mitsuaria sp. CC2]|uniref:AAA family ATPase n=1 Tax=Mitsuaria sp. CC2 TaxID=3029186 RepID=UPI003B8C192D